MLKIPKYPNLTELAYRHVKQSILEGSLCEGAKLTEELLATQLGISKSPIREALNRLESDGLVNIEPRRGAYVRSFTAKEASDLYDVRLLLEVHAVGMARVTSELLEQLSASITRTRQNLAQENRMAHIEEDIHFHALIAEAGGNQELCRVLEKLTQKTMLCRSRTYHLSASTAPESHECIYNALKGKNLKLARQAMRDHISFVRDALVHSLQQQESVAELSPAMSSR